MVQWNKALGQRDLGSDLSCFKLSCSVRAKLVPPSLSAFTSGEAEDKPSSCPTWTSPHLGLLQLGLQVSHV